MKLLLGVTGLPASGKSTVAEHWAKRGVAYVHMADFIWQSLRKQGIKESNLTGAMFGLYEHEILKDKPIIRWTDGMIKKNKFNPIILLDSVRSLEQHEHFKKKYKTYKLVAVLTNSEVRYERQIKRARFGEKITKRYCELRDKDELSRDLAQVIALADFNIDANCGKKEMLARADKLFAKIRK